MDHQREHRTPPLARVMGVGRQYTRRRKKLINSAPLHVLQIIINASIDPDFSHFYGSMFSSYFYKFGYIDFQDD